jgi:Leucine-rich repeat (LRR) protein
MLEQLICDRNQLTELDVSANTVLEWLSCNENQLTELDVTSNTVLTELYCWGNNMTSHDDIIGWREIGLFPIYNFVFMGNITPMSNGRVGQNYGGNMNDALTQSFPFWRLKSGSSLPNGLTLNTSTGIISGVPTIAGTFGFVVDYSDTITFRKWNTIVFSITIYPIANPTTHKVIVNSVETAFDAYTINGSNYFKLRDLAFVLSGTEKQFEVEWDSVTGDILLTSGKPYTIVGGEMTGKGDGVKTPIPTKSKIYLDGEETQFTAYHIEGNNYFKLRDVMKTFDVYVGWDEKTSIITIDTSKRYVKKKKNGRG